MESFKVGSDLFKVLPEDIQDIVDDWKCDDEENTFQRVTNDGKIKIVHYGMTVVEYQINSSQKMHGLCIAYYESKCVKDKVEYVNGIRHGKFMKYYEDGNIEVEVSYYNGLMHGKFMKYYEDGDRDRNIEEEAPYYNGLMHGMVYLYHKNGRLKSETEFHHGLKHGRQYIYDDYIYDEQANIIAITDYFKGKRNGFQIEYKHNEYLYPTIIHLQKCINDKTVQYEYTVKDGKFLDEIVEKKAYIEGGRLGEKGLLNNSLMSDGEAWNAEIFAKGRIQIHLLEGHYDPIGF